LISIYHLDSNRRYNLWRVEPSFLVATTAVQTWQCTSKCIIPIVFQGTGAIQGLHLLVSVTWRWYDVVSSLHTRHHNIIVSGQTAPEVQ